MPRKLKTYQTSLGFFDKAVAAPSIKAALQAWGADSNLFHQGAAKESDDPDIIAATMAKPGVVLRRPVGSNGSFAEHAELPAELGSIAKPSKVAANWRRKPNPPDQSTRPPSVGLLLPTNESKGAAIVKERKERSSGKRSGNADSGPSTRRRPHWTKPSGSMRKRWRLSKTRWKLSRRDPGPKNPVGSKKRGRLDKALRRARD